MAIGCRTRSGTALSTWCATGRVARRSRQGRLLAWLGIPASKYYDWRQRYGQDNRHNARLPRGHWLLDWEKAAILAHQREHPEEGYRRLAYMMLDADVVAVSPNSVYRTLKKVGRLGKGQAAPHRKGRALNSPALRTNTGISMFRT